MTSLHVRVRVGGESYALPVTDVLEVAALGEVAPLPGAPSAILGVRNLRGQILPVVDLANVLGLPAGTSPDRVVVTESGGRRAGLAVEAIDDVDELADADEPAESPYLTGAVLSANELIGVLNVASVLDSIAPVPSA
jgi:purine-binding chemotaxis protein CheW